MTPERPPSRSERLLRSTLERNPLASPNSSPKAHRRRHSHAPPSTMDSASVSAENDDDDDEFFRAAFLYRTPATASSPVRPQHPSSRRHGQRTSTSPSPTRDYYSHDSRSRSRAASPSSHYHQYPRPASPSPRRQSLHRSPASVDGRYASTSLQRHNSIPVRRRSNVTSVESQAFPLTPHEQVLRARLERVLISGRVVDERERSEHMSHGRRRSRRDSVSSGWPGSEQSGLASTPPKSASSSDHGHPTQSYQTHHRSRSKTDPLTSPSLLPTTFASPRRATTTTSPYFSLKPSSAPGPTQRNNSNSSSWTPPLTADTSPVLSEPLDHSLPGEDVDADVDSRLLLTPPPTPPLYGNFSATATATPALAAVVGGGSATATPGSISTTKYPAGVSMYRSLTRDSSDGCSASSPYLYQRREVDGSVEQLDLSLTAHPHHNATFNARKASERCRMMEGYVSFAQVEGLGMPPDGVDDKDDTNDRKGRGEGEGKRGRVLSVNIGTWARKLFVGVHATAAQS